MKIHEYSENAHACDIKTMLSTQKIVNVRIGNPTFIDLNNGSEIFGTAKVQDEHNAMLTRLIYLRKKQSAVCYPLAEEDIITFAILLDLYCKKHGIHVWLK